MGLGLELFEGFRFGDLRAEDLHRHRAGERGLAGAHDQTHAAAADAALQDIAVDFEGADGCGADVLAQVACLRVGHIAAIEDQEPHASFDTAIRQLLLLERELLNLLRRHVTIHQRQLHHSPVFHRSSVYHMKSPDRKLGRWLQGRRVARGSNVPSSQTQ